jgi:hypothetical protein
LLALDDRYVVQVLLAAGAAMLPATSGVMAAANSGLAATAA